MERGLRIVLTGGPGGGKTTAADFVRRELEGAVEVVPEAATMLFRGGFPRNGHPRVLRHVQRAIYEVQWQLEQVAELCHPEATLLCDRGGLDGAAYWPDGETGFFEELRTSMAQEIARYDAVIFFETAAKGGHNISSNNLARIENAAEAVEIDTRLRTLWQAHPNFHLVEQNKSFLHKVMSAVEVVLEIVRDSRKSQG
jgi:predicted ATPase